MTVTGRDRHRPNSHHAIQKGGRGGAVLLLAATLFLGGCSGNTNSSGPAAPLPTGQIGSIEAVNLANGNCYVSDTASCSTNSSTGANPITALATLVSSGTHYLYQGDGGGNIYYAQVSGTTLPSSLSPCLSVSPPIQALAVSPTALIYSTSNGVSYYQITPPCTTTSSHYSTSITLASGLTYAAGEFVGVTSNAQYFTCSTTTCNGPVSLPNLQDTNPNITAIATDPSNTSIVYILSQGSSTNRIYFYYVSGTTLTYLGNYSGVELNYPSGIALFQGNNPTSNYCTTGSCTFMDVTNTGNSTITQYVLTYSGSGAQTSISVNQFNNAYFNCDLINSSAIAAFSSAITYPNPSVFVGEQGKSTGPCFNITSGTTFGNNVTAYTVVGE